MQDLVQKLRTYEYLILIDKEIYQLIEIELGM